ncbi:WG repeat-containing protein [Tuwongella immobilis]|uniref:Uncharacterized protein n=1 Tax=Tuwongella immobilis TaxID=692036 RepID=A0A6C2YWC3_9BACT|nr:WG repeat-containing protein [Tuwongella immobilis]VIP05162.1 Kwg leptospira OS=Paenibacillus terrae (strain HPL-003) GN=HPL003_09860 PE=4 SV=1: WG_beta_rep: WG_beta_rep: WG_beta_rep [Tuwongella immobilis]VTS07680.1 Kwg leptospira OS=Paenibacillus terrae (strain HPL-003) GN=HPL003_09860 PE=4 SV=1: WG_beta_rep: WG_beta_rep: WG_beta_rep [Tuwongella immobilis]
MKLLIDRQGREVFRHPDMLRYSAGSIIVKSSVTKLWGAIHPTGHVLLPTKYNYVGHFSRPDPAFIVSFNSPESSTELYNICYYNGKFALSQSYPLLESFGGKMYQVMVEGSKLYGFCDHTGKLVIRCQFRTAGHFACGLCPIAYNLDELSFIDSSGRVVLGSFPGDYPLSATFTSNGLSCIHSQSKMRTQYILPDGTVAITLDPKFSGSPFYSSLAVVTNTSEGLSGCINFKGELVVKCKYTSIGAFRCGYSIAKRPDIATPVVIDITGREYRIAASMKLIDQSMTGICTFLDLDSNKRGFCTPLGEVLIKAIYSDATPMHDDFAVVSLD